MTNVSRCKAVVLGDKAVGKSSILNCLLGYPVPFSKRYNMTRGVDIVSKSIKLSGEPREEPLMVDIYFYDFSGRSVYTDLVHQLWTNNVSLVIGVFDVTLEDSFYHLQSLLADYMKQFTKSETVVGIILGNKVDLSEQRSVSLEECQQWAKRHRMRYFDVSAKDNIGIDDSFQHLIKTWLDSNRS